VHKLARHFACRVRRRFSFAHVRAPAAPVPGDSLLAASGPGRAAPSATQRRPAPPPSDKPFASRATCTSRNHLLDSARLLDRLGDAWAGRSGPVGRCAVGEWTLASEAEHQGWNPMVAGRGAIVSDCRAALALPPRGSSAFASGCVAAPWAKQPPHAHCCSRRRAAARAPGRSGHPDGRPFRGRGLTLAPASSPLGTRCISFRFRGRRTRRRSSIPGPRRRTSSLSFVGGGWLSLDLPPLRRHLIASGRKPGKVRLRCPERGRRIRRSFVARRSARPSSATSRSASCPSDSGSGARRLSPRPARSSRRRRAQR